MSICPGEQIFPLLNHLDNYQFIDLHFVTAGSVYEFLIFFLVYCTCIHKHMYHIYISCTELE